MLFRVKYQNFTTIIDFDLFGISFNFLMFILSTILGFKVRFCSSVVTCSLEPLNISYFRSDSDNLACGPVVANTGNSFKLPQFILIYTMSKETFFINTRFDDGQLTYFTYKSPVSNYF